MALSGNAEGNLNIFKDIFQEACLPHTGAKKEGIFAETLSQRAQRAARSNNHEDSEALLSFVVSCLETPEGFTVLDNVLFEVFSPLLECSYASRASEECFKHLIGVITARCTPREVIALFLAALDDSAGQGDDMPTWRSSDTQLLQALPVALGRLQRRHCEMLEDCLILVLKLVRCHMRPQTGRRHATTAGSHHTAILKGQSGAPEEGAQKEAESAASDCLSGARASQHLDQSSNGQQAGVSDAASRAEGEFLDSFAAFGSALPELVQAWPEAARGKASALLRGFLLRCCACTAQIHITADVSVLSRLVPHQRRAIFGIRPPAEDKFAAAQQLLADVAAVMCRADSKCGVGSIAEEPGPEASALWQAEEVALGMELLMHAALLREDVAAALHWPSNAADLLPLAAHSLPHLLDAAGKVRSEALVMKGLQFAAAAACHVAPASTLFGHDLQQLLHALATTMVANPLQTVRNAAHYATDAVLDALMVEARLSAIEALFEEGQPGLSALVIRRLAHDAQALWPPTDGPRLPQEGAASQSEEAVQQWRELEPALLPLIRAWLEPHAPHGWQDTSGVLRNAEPICAALNLLKLLLLRAKHSSNYMPGVTERRQLVELRERGLTPLRVAALRSLAELKAADDAALTEHIDAVLAVERVLLVLTWVLGAVEELCLVR